MPLIAPHRYARRSEGAFSIVEVIIAAFILTIVVVGATAVFGGSTKATGTAKVRDRQLQVADRMLGQLQADTSWSQYCRNITNDKFNAAQPDCNLSGWMANSRYANAGTVKDADGSTLKFGVKVVATGYDLAADKQGALDTDAVLPDVYRLRVTVTPDVALAKRYPQLKATTLETEMNPSARVQTGLMTVNACNVVNQVDQRIAAGSCDGGSSATPLASPPALQTGSQAKIASTCTGPVSETRGSDERDCMAYKCANAAIASGSLQFRDGRTCKDFPGWTDPSGWSAALRAMTTMQVEPTTGSVTLRSNKTGQVYSGVLRGGTVDFTGLPVGQYTIKVNATNGSGIVWTAKTVPGDDTVAVEAGLNSRAVIMFRPKKGGGLTVPIKVTDGSIPWQPLPLDGWSTIDQNGNVVPGGVVTVCMVPAPQGRLAPEDIPCKDFPRSASTVSFDFDDIEPGLYTAQFSDKAYTRFMSIQGTAGFIYVGQNGTVTSTKQPAPPLEYDEGLCAKFVRETIVGQVNPETGTVVQSCDGPSGPTPPGGSGGGPAS